MKSVAELTEELVNVAYEVEKLKYSRPRRESGWVTVAYSLAYGLDSGCGKRQMANYLQKRIDELNQELSDLCAKVEATN